jgi:hypothetical protein
MAGFKGIAGRVHRARHGGRRQDSMSAGDSQRRHASGQKLLAAPTVLPHRGLVDQKKGESVRIVHPQRLRAAVENLHIALLCSQPFKPLVVAFRQKRRNDEPHPRERGAE